MADSRNALSLLGGKGREQSACSAEKNVFQFTFGHLLQKIAAKDHGAASAAGTTGVYILLLKIKDDRAAVIINTADTDTVSAKQIQ